MRHTLSTTFLVADEAAPEWITWMKNNFIDTVNKLNIAEQIYFNKVVGAEQEGGVTFSVLLVFNNLSNKNQFINTLDNTLTDDINKAFPNKVFPFRTDLEEV